MASLHAIGERDARVLAGIMRGPGNYATPSPGCVARLAALGLVKKKRGRLAPTLKGRIVARLRRLR